MFNKNKNVFNKKNMFKVGALGTSFIDLVCIFQLKWLSIYLNKSTILSVSVSHFQNGNPSCGKIEIKDINEKNLNN